MTPLGIMQRIADQAVPPLEPRTRIELDDLVTYVHALAGQLKKFLELPRCVDLEHGKPDKLALANLVMCMQGRVPGVSQPIRASRSCTSASDTQAVAASSAVMGGGSSLGLRIRA